MKVFFYLASGFDRPGPGNHLTKALIEDVLKTGIKVHMLCSSIDNHEKKIPKEFLEYENFTYDIVERKMFEKSAFVKRYLEFLAFIRHSKKYAEKVCEYDAIFVQSMPVAPFAVSLMKKLGKGKPIVYNIQDMFPGSAIASGSMPQKWMQKIFYSLQKVAYKKADIITVISEDMKIKVMEQGVPENKIRVIVNWYDDTAVHEVAWEDNHFVKNYGLKHECFYVQYAGTMGTNFNPDPILEVAQRLKDEKNIVFQMIGGGYRRDKFEADAKERGLDNIVFYPLQPQDMVSDVYSACSVCLIPLKPGVIGNSVPSKAGLLMACRRVIVNSVDEDSDYASMFEREKIGFSSGITDYDKLAKDILFLYQNPDIRKEYADRAAAYGRKEYSRSVNTCKYIELFESLNSRGNELL